MTDFRALCTELVEHLEQSYEVHWHYAANKEARRCDDAVQRARAALAESELEKLTRKTLIINPVQIVECGGPCFEDGPEACDCGALWRDEPMSQPEPQPTTGESSTVQPADWEVTELVDWLRDAAKEAASADCVTDAWWLTHAAELLERLSPPLPIPVSERLPGPGDLHPTEGWCWVASKDCPSWHRVSVHFDAWFHWLPAHALPAPS